MTKSLECIFVIYYRQKFHISKEKTIKYEHGSSFFLKVFSMLLLQVWRKLWRATHERNMPNPNLHSEFMHAKTPTCPILLPGPKELHIFGALLV